MPAASARRSAAILANEGEPFETPFAGRRMHEPDDSPWETMRERVEALVHAHPLLDDIPCAATVEANRLGVRMVFGEWMVTVVSPDWYLPHTEDRARLIALNLAIQAREKYDEGAA